jgi:hypothetical protein
MERVEDTTKTLDKDFSALTAENKKKVLEMTKFLVLTQETIIPEMLNPTQKEKEKGLE